MRWESRNPRNLFGWMPGQRAAALSALRLFPELKLGPLAPRIMVLSGGCRGPWYVAMERKGGR